MTRRMFHGAPGVCAALAAGLLGGCGSDDDGSANAKALSCSELADYRVVAVNTQIIEAQQIDASASAPWTSPNGGGGSAIVTEPFCRVSASARPTTDSDIRFELWLPLGEGWNGKFAGTASGGSNGYISYGTVAQHHRMGYASVGHDNGHRAADIDFALNEQRKIDFAWRAQHVVTQAGKELTRAFYGRPARYAYYNGCSQSGHHGIMEMVRFPR